MKQLIIFLFVGSFFIFPVAVGASESVDQAKSDYRFHLEKYREEYRVFDLKRSQYNNLNTFASQEELVLAARAMLVRRAEVWRTYLQALRSELIETQGLDETEKAILANRIQEFQSRIESYRDKLAELKTKDDLVLEAQLMNGWNGELQAMSYEAMSHIVWGRLNGTIATERALTEKIKAAVTEQIRDEAIRDTRLRGFTEIERSLTLAAGILANVKTKFKNFVYGKGSNLDSEFAKVGAALGPAHDQLSRGLTLLSELSLGTEL